MKMVNTNYRLLICPFDSYCFVGSCTQTITGFYRSVKVNRDIHIGPNRIQKVNDLYVDGGLICNYPIYVFDGKLYK